jgi:hypothetical protein
MADLVKSSGRNGNQQLKIKKSQREFHGGFFLRDTLTPSILT